MVDLLLYEWEESAPPSVAVQQLVSLLSKPAIKVKCVKMGRTFVKITVVDITRV